MKKGAALLLAVLLCVLCGCAQPVRARQKTQITLINGWGDSSLDGDRIQELYARFNEENDDIQLNFLTLANTEAVVKVAADMLVVGRQPDIISVGGGAAEQLYRYIVENGCALDLMPYLQSDPDFTEDAAPLVSSGWATEDGRLYNLSDSMLVSGYWYNVDMFAQVGYDAPPGTWHELVELCTALRLNYPAVTPLALDPSSGRALLDAMIAGGSAAGTQAVAAYTASGFDFSDPCFIEGLQTFKTVCRVATGTVFGNNYANSISAFNKGMAAILTGDVWAKASISDELNVAFAPFPAYDGKRVACNSVGINYIICCQDDPVRQEACVRFLKFMLRDDIQEQLMIRTGQIPLNPNVSLDYYRESYPWLYEAAEAARGAQIQIEHEANLWRKNERAAAYFDRHISEYLDERPRLGICRRHAAGGAIAKGYRADRARLSACAGPVFSALKVKKCKQRPSSAANRACVPARRRTDKRKCKFCRMKSIQSPCPVRYHESTEMLCLRLCARTANRR